LEGAGHAPKEIIKKKGMLKIEPRENVQKRRR